MIEDNPIVAFLIHIKCPTIDVDTVLDETKSYASIRQKTQLYEFLTKALQECSLPTSNGVKQSDYVLKNDNSFPTSISHQSSFRLVSSKKVDSSDKHRSLTIPNDNPLVMSPKATKSSNEESVSPFSLLFMEDTNTAKKNKRHQIASKQPENDVTEKQALSVQEILLQATSDSVEKTYNDELQWSRKRIKAIEAEIRSLTKLSHRQGSGVGLNITKEMLSRAQFIAQLDAKFIVVNMDGIICAIDQHAADERIGLERLEKALERKLSANEDLRFYFNLSKKKCISSNDLMKHVPLQEPTMIRLSVSQMQRVRDHEELIKKWKFSIMMNDQCTELKLTGVPGLFDRVATTYDFIQFLQAIERRSHDLSLVRPAFVKRTLASYACRYAYMFGDELTEECCKQIIQDLSCCNMSFICAHGRPSVVPLIELASIESQARQFRGKSTSEKCNGSDYVPIRFRNRS